VQSPEVLRSALRAWGLSEISAQENGTLHVSAEGGYYSARPDLLATSLTEQMSEGIYTDEATAFLLFSDEQGQLRQQFLYPAAANPEALFTSDTTVILELNGHVFLQMGGKTYEGVLDYWVSVGEQRNEVQIEDIEDMNGDGLLDYQIHYPNGEQQVMFRF
jgi:hypothetical protein